MFIQKKALYNLILLNFCRFSNTHSFEELEKWQTENYREKSTDELLNRLGFLKIIMDVNDLEIAAKHFETPEEMSDSLARDRHPLEQDQVYLVVFELWRRHFPEKRSLSIFCDELDYQIMQYDLGKKVDIEQMQDLVAYLQHILDENVDKGMEPQQSFQLIQLHSANDIESFLFDYILEQIEEENYPYATELLEGYSKYISDTQWFEYLKARAEILRDPEEGYTALEVLIGTLNFEHLDLEEEILFFLANSGNHTLFYMLAKQTLLHLRLEEDLREFLEICYIHYDFLELKRLTYAIADIFNKRKHLDEKTPLSPEDPDLSILNKILNQKLSFAQE